MGRWKVVYDEEESRHRLDYSDEYSVYVHADRVDLEELRAAHNADCDRYEARIAELEAERDNANAYATWVDGLEAELARVKTESLRVVEVASMYNIFGGYSCGYFRWNGMVWRKSRQDKTHAVEINQNEVREFMDSVPVEWIRLEPWEADA